MKLRNYQLHTYFLCNRYAWNPSTYNRERLVLNLKRWAGFIGRDGPLHDYGYTGEPIGHVRYCSDRMNQGRAKALLRLLGDDS